jgi:predicted GNAT superfamily acetyltransferase
MSTEVKIVPLVSIKEQNFARNVFDSVWPMAVGTEITSNLMQAMVHNGAYLSGAFLGDECIGASFSFPGTTNGLHLHSHMTAVLGKFRNRGIGYALKIDQWHWAKENNYKEITWTFDPLVRRNAKLNLLKLAVDISAYHTNFYGPMADALNAGDETDRVVASWAVFGEEPISRNAILDPHSTDILISIPEDIVAIREQDMKESLKWRHKVREQFVESLANGGKVIGFSKNNEYVVRI